MLGQVMKQARLKKGYTQEQLADLVNSAYIEYYIDVEGGNNVQDI